MSTPLMRTIGLLPIIDSIRGDLSRTTGQVSSASMNDAAELDELLARVYDQIANLTARQLVRQRERVQR
jgi:hypothetical protein